MAAKRSVLLLAVALLLSACGVERGLEVAAVSSPAPESKSTRWETESGRTRLVVIVTPARPKAAELVKFDVTATYTGTNGDPPCVMDGYTDCYGYGFDAQFELSGFTSEVNNGTTVCDGVGGLPPRTADFPWSWEVPWDFDGTYAKPGIYAINIEFTPACSAELTARVQEKISVS